MRKFTRIKNDPLRSMIRLPRLGKIRLGIKKKSRTSGNEYPAEVDYFVCPPEVQHRYGAEPKALPVMLPTEDDTQIFRQYFACYGGNNKLKCQGDGEIAERRIEGEIKEVPCLGPEECEFANEKDEKKRKKNPCSARIDLLVVLPEINCGGVFQISSGSVNSDIDIRSGIEMTRSLFGRICWVPMELSRYEAKIPDPETGNMQTHWPMKLHPTANISEANKIRENTKLILERQSQYLLPEPKIEGEDDTPVHYVDEEDKPPAGAAEAQQATVETTATEVKEGAGEEPKSNRKPEYSLEQVKSFLSSAKSLESLEDVWLTCLESVNAFKAKEAIEARGVYADCKKKLN